MTFRAILWPDKLYASTILYTCRMRVALFYTTYNVYVLRGNEWMVSWYRRKEKMLILPLEEYFRLMAQTCVYSSLYIFYDLYGRKHRWVVTWTYTEKDTVSAGTVEELHNLFFYSIRDDYELWFFGKLIAPTIDRAWGNLFVKQSRKKLYYDKLIFSAYTLEEIL